ncbi:hypothetical protein AU189_17590 [Mycolicibacterium acapulense]|uniref:DUF2510 domain-containing protein n=1 Tax=Mycobacterium lehmannii TaxID=2048550 RepID=UPI00074624D1|nr:DUF2510 domain-containing protein [Mycobacterium lehmannii]KUH94643.1 hypothetical protein AU189_17590 [Mycolicibacterium acapulense]KUI15426.1 hypothetical protein AU191_06855 [Mycolicibacterium acapulense]
MSAGWFPDPSGQPGQRYYDGQRWTQHFAPTPPPTVTAPTAVAVAVSSGGGTNHALHLVLTLLSCGLWLPFWILFAIFGGSSGSAIAVGGGPGGVNVNTRSRTPLIVAGVILGLVVLGILAENPWLLLILVPMVGAGGFLFWRHKSAEARKAQELREQYRRDVLAARADYESKLYAEGDPAGIYGRYPPPPVTRFNGERPTVVSQRGIDG